MVHCGSAFEPGASRLPYYTSPMTAPDVISARAVWQQNTKKTKITIKQVKSHKVKAQFNIKGKKYLTSSMAVPIIVEV